MNEKDKSELKKKFKESTNRPDISFEKMINQLEIFEKGVPYIHLFKRCTVGDGIVNLSNEDEIKYLNLFERKAGDFDITKFVPASGAASRMFKKLEVLMITKSLTFSEVKKRAEDGNADCSAAVKFIEDIKNFAFSSDLQNRIGSDGNDINQWLKEENYQKIIEYTITEIGLNYSNLPKGAIKFHRYIEECRTAFEEHLIEALNYCNGTNNISKIHFTISHEHQKEFDKIIDGFRKRKSISSESLIIDFSNQKKSTNTVAVDVNNKPFYDKNGNIVFRPGGHGALLQNLDGIDSDFIFIKNIDNVCHDHFKGDTFRFKKILGGILISLQKKMFKYLPVLLKENVRNNYLSEVINFAKNELQIHIPDDILNLPADEKRKYLFKLLNRPIRVCGMVLNEGHPGGGPFWVIDQNNKISKQVVEKSQVDPDNQQQMKILNSATHFSPVDFVCGVKDYRGSKFKLDEFSNPNSGLITNKTFEGRELKALELPGLWNGGMANWISIFVQVPGTTFNPVKEVNDLLLQAHQPLNS